MRPRGFTLIELLIVVAIIAILAAIAVPNFLAGSTRSKVSRVQSDMRSLALAVEAYHVDNNRYPRQGPSGTCHCIKDHVQELTTPVAYITTYPLDVFHRQGGEPAPFNYGVCTSGQTYYYLWSIGPDKADQDAHLIYDPTNGTVSDGDIKRSTESPNASP